jgi:hypothetical protein
MIINDTEIRPEIWDGIPEGIQDILTDLDFRGRVKSNMQDGIRGRTIAKLKAGETVNLRAVAEREAKRLIRGKAVSTVEVKKAVEYIVGQLTGAIGVQLDDNGVRKFFCVGRRRYVQRELASKPYWAAEVRRVIRSERRMYGTAYALLKAMETKFGDLPDDIRQELDRMEETRTYAAN